jgi:hypothetical protein
MTDDESGRVQGVDFSTIDSVLDDVSYPITSEEFVDQYGDQEIDRTNAGPIAVGELLEGTGDQTFASAEEVRQMILNMMPEDSVGREGYSDRGGIGTSESESEDGFEGDESV